MNAAISVMVCDGVFKGSAFLLGDDIRNRSVAAFHRIAALWGQGGDCFYWFPSLNLCVIGLAV